MPLLRARNFQASQRNYSFQYRSHARVCGTAFGECVAFTPNPHPQPYTELCDNRILEECTYYNGQIRCRTTPINPLLRSTASKNFSFGGNDNTSIISWQVGRHARTARGYARNHCKSSTSLDYRGPSPRAPETNQVPGPRGSRKA